MSDEAREAEVGNRVCNETVVEFLRVVDLLAARDASDMDVTDAIEIIPQVAGDISVHDLNVVDVKENLNARRINLLAHIKPPGEVIENLVGALIPGDFRIRDLHAESDALLFSVAFDAIEYRGRVVGGFFIRHAAAFARKSNESRTAD